MYVVYDIYICIDILQHMSYRIYELHRMLCIYVYMYIVYTIYMICYDMLCNIIYSL